MESGDGSAKKDQLLGDGDSFEKNSEGQSEALPDIDARILEKSVLLKIHCKKRTGFLSKILGEIEQLHLNVVNSNVLPFGDYFSVITVVAQMDDGFCMEVEDLVKNLRIALLKFI